MTGGAIAGGEDDHAWLRLHIEAVWGVSLPPLAPEVGDVTIAPTEAQPPWALYLGELIPSGERIHIWRAGVAAHERPSLLARGAATLASIAPSSPGVSSEVALRPAAPPRPAPVVARPLARRLQRDDVADRALLVAFLADDAPNPDNEEAAHAALAALGEPLIGVVVDGRLCALAQSARRTAQACELGIETLPAARRRGYALAATVAWSARVADAGLLPIYSAFTANAASLALAAAAGYRPFARGAQVSEAAQTTL